MSRSEEWRAELSAAFGRLRAEHLDGPARSDQLDGRLRTRSLGRVGAFLVAGTPQIVRRTPTAIHDAPADPLKVCIQRTGRAIVHQGDVEVEIRPGQLALYDTGRPYELRLDGDWACSVMTIPRQALGLPGRMVTAGMAHAFPAASGPGAIIAHLLDDSTVPQSPGTDQLGEAGVLLMASLLRSTAAPTTAPGDLARARILAYLSTHLGDPELSHASVAAAHGMSPRSLHRLFQGEPQTVTEIIRTRRLDTINSELVAPAFARRSTMAIAASWGFSDQAHFTRSFRARFGVTPGAVRRVSTTR